MEITAPIIGLLLLTGATAGIAAGFIGIGGGVIMVPVLLELFRAWGIPDQVLVQAAMGTSLSVATFSVGSSAIRHHIQGNVLWKVVPFIFPMSMLGGYLASTAASLISGVWLQLGLAVALLFAAGKMLLEKGGGNGEYTPKAGWIWAVVGMGTGLFSGFTGLAGGLVLVPAMALIAKVPTRNLAATSSAVVVFTAFAAAIGYMVNAPEIELPAGFVGHTNLIVAVCIAATSIPGAQLGAWLNKKSGSV
ncbi:sulfite exporter TauE/SafE family protein, partial [bacterium]|nr:sulfite exporter TauE/SafE family protein [bacterium]